MASRQKHNYETTRTVTDTFRFHDLYGQHIPSHDVEMERKPSVRVFRGGKRAFAAHLAMLNTLHGPDYARPWEFTA